MKNWTPIGIGFILAGLALYIFGSQNLNSIAGSIFGAGCGFLAYSFFPKSKKE
jgi:hypothetical protein